MPCTFGAIRRSTRTGFTMIEIVIVLSVVGVLALFAIPNFDLSRFRVNSAMQGISSTLMAAQRQAVTRQHDIVVTFDVTGNAMFILDDADNDGAASAGERQRRVPLGETIVFGRGAAPAFGLGAATVTFTKTIGGRPAVIFHRGGSASESGGFYLTTQEAVNTGGRLADTRALEIERSTGRVSWYRYTGTAWERGF